MFYLLVVFTCVLMSCGTLRTQDVDFKYVGQATLTHCEAVRKYPEGFGTEHFRWPVDWKPEEPRCTKIETKGFSGWGILDGLIGLVGAWWSVK